MCLAARGARAKRTVSCSGRASCPLRRRTVTPSRPGVLTPSGHLWRSSSPLAVPPSMQQKNRVRAAHTGGPHGPREAPRCICGPSPHGRRADPRGVDSQNEGEKNAEISNYVTSPPSENSPLHGGHLTARAAERRGRVPWGAVLHKTPRLAHRRHPASPRMLY
jgi:hypothetical protein